jgi:hypothetical protein
LSELLYVQPKKSCCCYPANSFVELPGFLQLDATTANGAKAQVDESSDWVWNKIMLGLNIYGVTTGFGATSHHRTQERIELQRELIR